MELLKFNEGDNYVSTTKPLLKPWDIYEVTFKGCEYNTFAGKKDPEANYEVLKFNFETESGRYTETLFAPKASDSERKTRKNANGHVIAQPSNLDYFINTVGQILKCISPETLEKLQKKAMPFSTMAQVVAESTKSSIGKKVFLKLIGNNKNEPRLPYFLSIFENSPEPKVTSNFISANKDLLAFSDFELTRKEKMATAKPTNMASVANTSIDGDNSDISDLDLDL